VDAGIGFDLEQGPVVFEPFDEECFGVCYFHRWWNRVHS
jgi:hypothetical protein